MEVVLLEEVKGRGGIGSTVRVKDGYYRNYLQPRGIALEATPANLRFLEERKQSLQRKAAKELNSAKALAAELDKLTLTFALKAGENDRLFGSVTSADVAEAIEKQGFTVDRRKIVLEEPIKTLGMYTVHIHLGPDVEAKVKALVEKKMV